MKYTEQLLESLINFMKEALNKAFDKYEYLTKFFIIIIILSFYLILKKLGTQLSIVISISSALMSAYLTLRSPKCKIREKLVFSKKSGVFIELYSNNKSTCIVNIESIILKDKNNNNLIELDSENLSNQLPSDILKGYILSNDNISTIPLVYSSEGKFAYEGKTYFHLATTLNLIYTNQMNVNNTYEENKIEKVVLHFKRSDKSSGFDITLDFNKIQNYKL